jgi:DNA repair photolyase
VRWRLSEDDDGQGALFEEEVERHIGRGEFRGMEFLHVNARSIINEIPKASLLPFRWTINAYRGCSHSCAYCLRGDTPVLLANGRTKPIEDLRVGDRVYGTERRGAYRRYASTEVLAHWTTTKRAYRLLLEDDTSVVTSGDHRFLTNRGWKHVTGAGAGFNCRPHLTVNNELLGTGAFAAPPQDTPEYRRGYLCGMIRGDANLASYSYVRAGRAHGDVHRFRLALVDLEPLQRTREYLLDGGIATQQFVFHEAVGAHKRLEAIRTSSLGNVEAIREIIRWLDRPSGDWAKGFLAGIFDAEGSYSRGILRICNTDLEIIDRIAWCLRRLGFPFVIEGPRENGVRTVRVTGGVQQHLQFFVSVDPATTRKRTIDGYAIKNKAKLRVTAIEDLGVEMPMYDITTGTGDFIANGVVSHNCFARPTHEYLDMNAGDDFERKIVVKINAVEKLRSELHPSRWAGDHIAMGTNTDPYQRCEGKYHLTRGIVETLAEHANPFSILTKSTLILRDLDILTEAAQRADVRANFSIGTLDEEVWKTSEPGTPHPKRRVEAVARLNEAGIPTGVLVAPILPGLSDRPDQIEAVVRACAEAGAVSISPILLHLRPGVKEQYMPWLEKQRPDLKPLYDKLYPRSYAPKEEQRKLSRLVYGFVRKHGGCAVEPGDTRDTGHEKAKATAAPKRRAAPPPQLDLGV